MRIFLLCCCLFVSGCVTRHYHVHTDVPYRMGDSVSQDETNRVWGTSRLRVINVRRIPQTAMEEAKCNDGFVQFCK